MRVHAVQTLWHITCACSAAHTSVLPAGEHTQMQNKRCTLAACVLVQALHTQTYMPACSNVIIQMTGQPVPPYLGDCAYNIEEVCMRQQPIGVPFCIPCSDMYSQPNRPQQGRATERRLRGTTTSTTNHQHESFLLLVVWLYKAKWG